MTTYFNAILDSLAEVTAEMAIGGVFLALILTGPMALVYAASRRKQKDVTMILVAVAVGANFAGMVVALGFQRLTAAKAQVGVKDAVTVPMPHFMPPGSRPPDFPPPPNILARELASRVLRNHDSNQDGRVSTDEAVAAATALIRSAAVDGEDSIDEDALHAALAAALQARLGRPARPNSAADRDAEEKKKRRADVPD